MTESLRAVSFLAIALATACGTDASQGGGGADSGADATLDASADAPPDTTDSGPDATSDAAPDAVEGGPDAAAVCGDGTLDNGEACDTSTFPAGVSCSSFGLPNGTLGCTAQCEVDTTGCQVCGDGICSDGEDAVGCAADCGVKSISAGRTHTCAVLADGTLWCWGAHDGHGMGGTPDVNKPVRMPGIDDAVQVATSYHSTCWVNTSNEVWCFGRSGFGESGATLDYVTKPVKATDGKAVFGGGYHFCAITPADHVVCWGRGDYGQRGDGTYTMRRTAAQDTGLPATARLTLGENFSCARAGAAIACWGDNTQGQIGRNNRAWTNTPSSVLGAHVFGAGAGAQHACFDVINTAAPPQFSGLLCTGSNAYGQLGAPPSNDILAPVRIGPSMEDIVGGHGYTCAVNRLDPNAIQTLCWGDNYFGELGDGTTTSRYTPAPVTGITDVTALSGGYDHVCAILPDGTARCWGRNREGQLGIGSDVPYASAPIAPLRLGPAASGGAP